MARKYDWDELEDKISPVKAHYSERADVPKEEKDTWQHKETHPNGTRVYASYHHYAAETDAENKKEARTKMQEAMRDHTATNTFAFR